MHGINMPHYAPAKALLGGDILNPNASFLDRCYSEQSCKRVQSVLVDVQQRFLATYLIFGCWERSRVGTESWSRSVGRGIGGDVSKSGKKELRAQRT